MEKKVILPGDNAFEETVANINLYRAANVNHIAKNYNEGCWVYGLDGLPRWVNQKELEEYLGGGEYEQREEQMFLEEQLDPFIVNSVLNPIE